MRDEKTKLTLNKDKGQWEVSNSDKLFTDLGITRCD